MQRILSRAARRCTNSSAAFKPPHVANAASVHSEDAPTCSNMITEYDDFTWKTSFVRPLQSEVVNALRRGDRQRASLILSNFHHTKEALTKEVFYYILEYCAEAPDPLALNCLALLGEKESTYATIPIFNIFLNACGSRANLKDAECCLEILENLFLGKSEITYCELLKLAVLQGNLPAAYDIWKDCFRYYSPNIITQRRLIRALTALGDLQSAYHILQHMVALAARSSDYLRVSSKRRYQSSRLDIPVPALNEFEDLTLPSCQGKLVTGEHLVDAQPELFEEKTRSGNNLSYKVGVDGVASTLKSAPSAGKQILRWAFNDVLHACVQFNNCQLAEHLFTEIKAMERRALDFTVIHLLLSQ
ncbi:pentatricopeptide repeat-containing protein At1g76280-like isoform X4 [Miscanthus floridulus]|uniref:pentatricopeptide repeat-containing protein At1g76280-like isoform X4 n=1 Tax=Miscanthus floridulus TaxID=154761 RepID=UPI0034585709